MGNGPYTHAFVFDDFRGVPDELFKYGTSCESNVGYIESFQPPNILACHLDWIDQSCFGIKQALVYAPAIRKGGYAPGLYLVDIVSLAGLLRPEVVQTLALNHSKELETHKHISSLCRNFGIMEVNTMVYQDESPNEGWCKVDERGLTKSDLEFKSPLSAAAIACDKYETFRALHYLVPTPEAILLVADDDRNHFELSRTWTESLLRFIYNLLVKKSKQEACRDLQSLCVRIQPNVGTQGLGHHCINIDKEALSFIDQSGFSRDFDAEKALKFQSVMNMVNVVNCVHQEFGDVLVREEVGNLRYSK
jgi:hypothetical protein